MRKSRCTEEQTVKVLHEWEAGSEVADLVRRHGGHRGTRFLVITSPIRPE